MENDTLNFLEEEEAQPIEEQAAPADELSGINFIEGSEEPEAEVEMEESEVEPVGDYHQEFMNLIQSGFIDPDDLPEDISTDPDSPTTAEDTLKALLHNLPKRDQQLVQYGQNSLVSKLPKQMQDALSFAINDGDPLEYLKTALETQDIISLNPENEVHQEKIVREFYKTTDLTGEEINEKIEELKDLNLLEREAGKLKPKLDKRAEEVAKQKVEAQANIKAQKDQAATVAANRIASTLQQGFDNMMFTQEEAANMLNLIMTEQDFDYGTHKATKTGAEYLMDFHKYAQNGDPSRVIKAMMFLDPQGRFDHKFEEVFGRKVKDQFVKDHVTNSQNKFKATSASSKPRKTNSNSKTKFKFNNGI